MWKSNFTSLFLLLHSTELNEEATEYFTVGSYLIWHTEWCCLQMLLNEQLHFLQYR